MVLGMPRILILSVSAGAGHVRAAQAIETAAKARGIEAVHWDAMDSVNGLFRKFYAHGYVHVVNQYPALWSFLYHTTDHVRASMGSRIQAMLEYCNTRGFVKKVRKIDPEIIICTHFLPPQLLTPLCKSGKLRAKIWTVVTDFDVHATWVCPGIDGYFVAAEEVASRLRWRDPSAKQITVTGIPIAPAFKARLDRTAMIQELGLDPSRQTLLLMSGGEGIGRIDQMAERILQLGSHLQVIALAGRNADLLAKLQTIAAKEPRLKALGFTTTIERLMSAADLAVGKPGGLTTSECLALGLPLVVAAPIPGQEERNSDYLLEHGAGLRAYDGGSLEHRIKRILSEPDLLPRLTQNAQKLGHPNAANEILDVVLDVVEKE
jgi:processive 1,2-diacylglycerol beta-glucosyltransferase